MLAIDFVLYCSGISVVLVSAAAAIRLITSPRGTKEYRGKDWAPPAPPVPIPDPAGDALQDRLQAFQSARFASPIVQRRLDADAGPAPRSFPPAAPRRPLPPPPRKPDNVIPIPLKMRKPDNEPPKEGA